jgi:hypothetical protein
VLRCLLRYRQLDEDAIDEAEDADEPEEEFIKLILKHTQGEKKEQTEQAGEEQAQKEGEGEEESAADSSVELDESALPAPSAEDSVKAVLLRVR